MTTQSTMQSISDMPLPAVLRGKNISESYWRSVIHGPKGTQDTFFLINELLTRGIITRDEHAALHSEINFYTGGAELPAGRVEKLTTRPIPPWTHLKPIPFAHYPRGHEPEKYTFEPTRKPVEEPVGVEPIEEVTPRYTEEKTEFIEEIRKWETPSETKERKRKKHEEELIMAGLTAEERVARKEGLFLAGLTAEERKKFETRAVPGLIPKERFGYIKPPTYKVVKPTYVPVRKEGETEEKFHYREQNTVSALSEKSKDLTQIVLSLHRSLGSLQQMKDIIFPYTTYSVESLKDEGFIEEVNNLITSFIRLGKFNKDGLGVLGVLYKIRDELKNKNFDEAKSNFCAIINAIEARWTEDDKLRIQSQDELMMTNELLKSRIGEMITFSRKGKETEIELMKGEEIREIAKEVLAKYNYCKKI